MARIRTIKPEFFASEDILKLSHTTRLTFIGLWTHCDDVGRCRDDARIIKGALWPLEDEVTWKDVAAHLDELAERQLICRFEHGGKPYLHIVTWAKHQVVPKASKPRHPECPRATHGGPDPSGNPPVTLPEDSGRAPEIPVVGTRNRELGTRNRVEGANAPVPQAGPVSITRQLDDFWRTERGKDERTKHTPARQRSIDVALKAGYPPDDIRDAIRGVALDPWPDRPKNDDITIVLRLGGRGTRNNLEHFRDLWRAQHDPRTAAQRDAATLAEVERAREARHQRKLADRGEAS